MYQPIQQKVHLLLDPRHRGTLASRIINSVIVILIVINTLAVMLETVEKLYSAYERVFYIVELLSVIIFSIEYVLRVWCCTLNKKYSHPIKGRIKYVLSPGALIDLLAILPFFIPMFIKADLRFLRVLRLARFSRFFKLGRYVNASHIIRSVFKSKKEELVLSFVITMFLIVIASSVIYYAEHDAQPDKFSSIPETMLWSVATLTTAGYGDEHPVTPLGKFLTACISILGIGIFALPAGILASGFSDEFKKLKNHNHLCPHCHQQIDA